MNAQVINLKGHQEASRWQALLPQLCGRGKEFWERTEGSGEFIYFGVGILGCIVERVI